ncbi:hypothetical protein FocnCong_v013464 [Fusarium oxysporum f. sp. conglutinans]|nr:hypothetical protein FocnCong_v013464 [Fusarium oxysporum f. sp. conglutinans]
MASSDSCLITPHPTPSPTPSLSPSTPTPLLRPTETPPEDEDNHEATLRYHFRGWALSERSRETASWDWPFGYDIQMNWIVARNHSFSIAEENELREIFDYLNPSVSVRDANLTHTTIKEKATSAFKQHKQKVVEVLRKAPGLIHISFDGWRSGNRHALYGVCCFFRDENNKPCKVTIGVPELSVSHTGTNIAAEILDVIEAYQIQDKIG